VRFGLINDAEYFARIVGGVLSFDVGIVGELGFKLHGDEEWPDVLQLLKLEYNLRGERGVLDAQDLFLGFVFLSALSWIHGLSQLQGLDTSRALCNVLDFYEAVGVANPDAISALHKLLHTPLLDSDNLFATFLKDATDARLAKTDLARATPAKDLWRQRRIAWLLSKQQIDLPADLSELRQ
ncbi:MAG: hypothetical protein WC394_04955, partial [Candidatus Omnitrophota bacterium]